MVLAKVPEVNSSIRSLPLEPISVSRARTAMVLPAVASETTSFCVALLLPVRRSRFDTARVAPSVLSTTPRVPIPLIPDQTSLPVKV